MTSTRSGLLRLYPWSKFRQAAYLGDCDDAEVCTSQHIIPILLLSMNGLIHCRFHLPFDLSDDDDEVAII